MPEITKKQWEALREWLAKLHPAVRLKYLKLALREASDEIKPDVETMIREAEDELVGSPEWRQFGRPAPASINIEELFPALAGPGEEERTLERRLATLAPAKLAEEEAKKGVDIYRPGPKEFETEYKPLSPKGYREAREGIKELYEKVTGQYEWSKSHGVAPEEFKRLQEESRQILPDAVRVSGGASPSSEIYRRMLVRTEQMMRTMQGLSERTRREMETYRRSERGEEERRYAS